MANTLQEEDIDDILLDAQIGEVDAQIAQQLKMHRKQNIVVNIFKQINVDKMSGLTAQNKANIQSAIDYMHVNKYLDAENPANNPLGISSAPPELSYVEQKAIQNAFSEEFKKFFEPIETFAATCDQSVFDPQTSHQELVDAKEGKTRAEERLMKAKSDYAEALKMLAEVKVGEKQQYEAEALRAKNEVIRTKAELLTAVTKDNILNASKRGSAAVSIVKQDMKSEIEKKQAKANKEVDLKAKGTK